MEWTETLGLVVGAASLGVAVIQTGQLAWAARQRRMWIWAQMASVKAMMRHLEREDPAEAYSLVCQQFRDLLREAALNERAFGVGTVVAWRRVGRLSSKWQERQALMFVEGAASASEEELSQVGRYGDFDETGVGHPVARLGPRDSRGSRRRWRSKR